MLDIVANGEFGYEMVLAVPYAYWLHETGNLRSTTSCIDTKPLYFFSDNHTEYFQKRSDCLGDHTHIPGCSFYNLHTRYPNFSKWKFPDYNSHFKNDIFVYNKPLMIVSNKRYSNGSTQRHGSFTDNQLRLIFDTFNNDYRIIYNRAKSNKITVDVQIPNDTDSDFELLKDYNNIIDINVLHDSYRDQYTFNELQFMLHANCDTFISVQGGSSILSSAFGGRNLIYATSGQELIFNSFAWYTEFSKCNIMHAADFNTFTQLMLNFK